MLCVIVVFSYQLVCMEEWIKLWSIQIRNELIICIAQLRGWILFIHSWLRKCVYWVIMFTHLHISLLKGNDQPEWYDHLLFFYCNDSRNFFLDCHETHFDVSISMGRAESGTDCSSQLCLGSTNTHSLHQKYLNSFHENKMVHWKIQKVYTTYSTDTTPLVEKNNCFTIENVVERIFHTGGNEMNKVTFSRRQPET